jgi:hypothetical protein
VDASTLSLAWMNASCAALPITVSIWGFDTPPPHVCPIAQGGSGFITVTGKLPAVAKSLVRRAAVTWVALTNAVVRSVPLNWTFDAATKLVPLTVAVRPSDPTTAFAGDTPVVVGVGAPAVDVDTVDCET